MLPLMVADPAPETEQPADPGTPSGDPVYLSESWLPVSVPVNVPEMVMAVTAGEVNSVAGPETALAPWLAVQVTRKALPPPDPAPTMPDQVPARLGFCDGDVVDPAQAVVPTTSRLVTKPRTTVATAATAVSVLLLPKASFQSTPRRRINSLKDS